MIVRIALAALVISFVASPSTGRAQPASPAVKQIPPPPDVAAAPADAGKTASGLASKVIAPGTGDRRPQKTDMVTVHYTGWTSDGRMFDSSHVRGKPNTFEVQGVLPGWSECVSLMTIGETRRCWVPQELAYRGAPGRPAGTLVFDIELLDAAPSPRVPPPDVAAPPADARRTASGLAYKVLTPGTGTQRPSSRSRVTVHYTGWTTDGKMFDSSVTRGAPSTFGLDQVIKGWTEGVQLMVPGEKTRFWIPQDLAYRGEQPRGMLVFDIELIRVDR